MSMTVSEERAVRPREVAEALKASGALDGIFAQIDAGTPLTGQDGLLTGVVKAALERGLVGRAERASGLREGRPGRGGVSELTWVARVVRRPAPRSGTWIWTCLGTGPARCTAMLVPNGAAPSGRAGRDDHQLVRRRNDGARHPAPSGCHHRHRAGATRRLARSPIRSARRSWPGRPGLWRPSTR